MRRSTPRRPKHTPRRPHSAAEPHAAHPAYPTPPPARPRLAQPPAPMPHCTLTKMCRRTHEPPPHSPLPATCAQVASHAPSRTHHAAQ
eukprot:6974545-Prymnesium_polylepis.1